MKKTIVTALGCLVLALCMLCTGCELGSYQDHPGAVGKDNTESDAAGATDTPSENATGDAETSDETASGETATGETDTPPSADTPYTVSLFYKNKAFAPGDAEIEVIWQSIDSDTVVTVPLDENGEAGAGVLDGDFNVYLSGLPETYSYDPNIYKATGNSRHVDINIVEITQPVRGDGGVNSKPALSVYQSGGCYVVNYQGTYRATVEKGQTLYYEYQPTTAGRYVVETWVNVYDDEINPVMEIWGGTVAYKWLQETRDTGGAALDGGFTKNVKYEINLANVGPSYTFGISAVSKTGEYPVTVDFCITYEGPYDKERDVTKVIDAEEAKYQPKPKSDGLTFHYANMDTMVFNENHYAYDGDMGVWRVYDPEKYADNDGWGPYLCAIITETIPCYSETTLYEAYQVGGSPGQGPFYNRLRPKVWDDEVGGYVTYDYEAFIRTAYAAKCNEDGVCYVTQELKEFLALYAKTYNLWTDGVCPCPTTEDGDLIDPITPEDYGYGASEDSMWLFACGFYE